MKKVILAVMVIAGTFLTLSNAEAAYLTDMLKDKGIDASVSANVSYYSKYVWRGQVLDNDTVMQSAVNVSIAGFEGGFWGNWDLVGDDSLMSDEVDGWIGYSFDLGFINPQVKMIGVSFGNTWYAFPGTDGYDKETYLTLSADTFLSPYATWYHSYGKESQGGAHGDDYAFGISHSFDVLKNYGVTLDTGVELGLNHEAFIAGDGGYTLWKAGLTIPLSDSVSVNPNIAYSAPFGDLKSSSDGNQPDQFYGGVSMDFGF